MKLVGDNVEMFIRSAELLTARRGVTNAGGGAWWLASPLGLGLGLWVGEVVVARLAERAAEVGRLLLAAQA
jgi:hypothetical protein